MGRKKISNTARKPRAKATPKAASRAKSAGSAQKTKTTSKAASSKVATAGLAELEEKLKKAQEKNERLENALLEARCVDTERIRRLKKLSELSLTLSGNPMEVFNRIAGMIGELMEVPVVCLSEIRGRELFFLSVYAEGKVVSEAGHCPISITPCATVQETRDMRVYQDVSKLFPQAEFLSLHNANSYCGFPSLDNQGNVVAVMCLLDDRPREFSEEDRELLNVFSQRVGMEMERMRILRERKEVEATLRETNTRMNTLIQTIPDIVMFKDAEGRHLMVNRACERFLDMASEDILGKTAEEMLPPKAAAKCRETDEEAMRVRGPLVFEERMGGGDSEIVLETVKSPILGADGKATGLLAMARDITERKHVEDRMKASVREKVVLLQEIHHRVKNNMAIISSFLRLQSRMIKDEEVLGMFRDSQNRIKSMALVHEKLYQSSDFSRIDFGEYVKSLAEELFYSYGIMDGRIALKVEVDDVYMQMDTLIPCGLIINELLTNSLKHAFKGVESPEIRIGLKRGKADAVTLTIGDNGRGFEGEPDIAKADSLGLQIINSLVTQLRGRIAADISDGTAFTISFSLPK